MEGFHTFNKSCFANFTREFSAFGSWLETELKGRDDALSELQKDLASARSCNERLALKLENALEELSSTKKPLNVERHRGELVKAATSTVASPRQAGTAIPQAPKNNQSQDGTDQKYQILQRKYDLMKKQVAIYKRAVDVLHRRLKAALPAEGLEGGKTGDRAAPPAEPHDVSLTQGSVDCVSSNAQETEQIISHTNDPSEIRASKRKRSRSPAKPTEPDGSRDQPFKIKEEPNSSPVQLMSLIGTHPTSDSLDLDELQGAVETPRKQRRLQLMLENRLRHAPFQTPSPVKPNFQVFETDVLEDRSLDVETSSVERNFLEANVGLTSKTSPPPRLQLEQPSTSKDSTTKVQNQPRADTIIHSADEDTDKSKLDNSRILRPLSVNRRVLKISHDRSEKRRGSRASARAIAALAEDGSYMLDTGNLSLEVPDKSRLPVSTSPLPDSARLEDLLNRQVSAAQPLPSDSLSAKLSIKTHHSRNHEDEPLAPATGGGEHHSNTPASSRLQPSASTLQTLPQTARPSSARQSLRERRVQDLRLEDFKVNPTRNQGIDFAFVEVVRNQEQRKGMAHCTRPGCCGGSFSKALQIAGAPERRSGLWDQSSSGHQDDDLLLRDYLGDNCTLEDVRKLSVRERNELLGKARIASFAATHGKHRYSRHRRQSTPPGFWRTDMPSTQEMEQDKALAEERERRKVEERYAEAMQANGLWKFRDE